MLKTTLLLFKYVFIFAFLFSRTSSFAPFFEGRSFGGEVNECLVALLVVSRNLLFLMTMMPMKNFNLPGGKIVIETQRSNT